MGAHSVDMLIMSSFEVSQFYERRIESSRAGTEDYTLIDVLRTKYSSREPRILAKAITMQYILKNRRLARELFTEDEEVCLTRYSQLILFLIYCFFFNRIITGMNVQKRRNFITYHACLFENEPSASLRTTGFNTTSSSQFGTLGANRSKFTWFAYLDLLQTTR